MKIECLVKREGGSVVEVFGANYHFIPADDGCHVADVENTKHQDRLLSISEGYRIYRGGEGQADGIKPVQPKDEPPVDEGGKTDFTDLSKLDALELSNEDLLLFATEVMGVSTARKAFVTNWYAEKFGGEEPLDASLTTIELIRLCAMQVIAAEKAASE